MCSCYVRGETKDYANPLIVNRSQIDLKSKSLDFYFKQTVFISIISTVISKLVMMFRKIIPF